MASPGGLQSACAVDTIDDAILAAQIGAGPATLAKTLEDWNGDVTSGEAIPGLFAAGEVTGGVHGGE